MRMDAAQFERLVSEHQRMVFSIALHSLRNRAVAEEITQDVFVALYQHHGEIESPEHLVYWLRRVTTRRCIDQVRRQRLRRWIPLGELAEPASAPAAFGTGDPMLSVRLQRLIGGLPALPRLVLVLRYQEDLDVPEIGRVVGIPESAVKKHLRRALTHLKLRLRSPHGADEHGSATTFEGENASEEKSEEGGARTFRAVRAEMAQPNLEHQ